jgi:hypothetical protein
MTGDSSGELSQKKGTGPVAALEERSRFEELESGEISAARKEELMALLEAKSKNILGLGGQEFLQRLDELSEILFQLSPSTSALMQAIDKKGQDFSTYFVAAYSDTHDIEKSLRIFRTVRSLVRYIVLMDRYYEKGNVKYKQLATELLKRVRRESKGHLKYSIPFSFKACWPFWDFEILMKKRMLAGLTFSISEIRNHNMFKSSDAPAIYANVLDSELPTFDRNVSLILHYNQALQDIKDDFEDLEEDLFDKMPNIFFLGAVETVPFSELEAHPEKLRETIARSGVIGKVIRLVSDYEQSALGIQLPPAYEFLKTLTKKYAREAREISHIKGESASLNNVADSEVSKVLCP